MASEVSSATARGAAALEMDERVVRALRERLPEVATQTVAAVTVEVPGYTGALSGSMGANIEAAVTMALGGFLKLAAGSRGSDPSTPLGPTLEGAYALGRGEARSGRSMDALLAAYRVGARVAWREMARAAAEAGVEAATMAQFAELVFAYIDELSASSVAGHSDELSTSGRVRERYRERLGQHLLAGANLDVLAAAAERAGWPVPVTLTAVLLPAAQVRGVLASLGPDTVQVGEDLPGAEPVDPEQPFSLLLVPDVEAAGPPAPAPGARRAAGRGRAAPTVAARPVVVRPRGPDRGPRPRPAARGRPVDSEEHLADLVVGADPEALGRPAGPGARAAGRAAAGDPGAARGDAAVLAAAPGPPRRGGRGAARPRADGALPDGTAARAVRRPARRPAHGAGAGRRAARADAPSAPREPATRPGAVTP